MRADRSEAALLRGIRDRLSDAQVVTMEVFFNPELEKNEEGKWIVKALPKATDMNYIPTGDGLHHCSL